MREVWECVQRGGVVRAASVECKSGGWYCWRERLRLTRVSGSEL